MGKFITNSPMMHTMRRSIGPPNSHAHWPLESCGGERYGRPLCAASRGVQGVGRPGRPWAIVTFRLGSGKKEWRVIEGKITNRGHRQSGMMFIRDCLRPSYCLHFAQVVPGLSAFLGL